MGKTVSLESGCPETDSGTHEMTDVVKEEILNLEGYTAYQVTRQCQHCSHEVSVFEVDDQPETVAEFESVLYQLYESFYDRPRSIGHMVLLQLAPGDDTGKKQALADCLAEAVDLGVEHRKDNRDKLTRQKLLDWTMPELE